MSQKTEPIKTLPWGEKIFVELPVYTKSANRFYARQGQNAQGRTYIEFTKFGPKPDTEGEVYTQKLRLYDPKHWIAVKQQVESKLFPAAGWSLARAISEFEKDQAKAPKN